MRSKPASSRCRACRLPTMRWSACSRPTATCGCASATTCPRRVAGPRPSAASRNSPPNWKARCTACTATTRNTTGSGSARLKSQLPSVVTTSVVSPRPSSSSCATTPTSPSWPSTTSPAGRRYPPPPPPPPPPRGGGEPPPRPSPRAGREAPPRPSPHAGRESGKTMLVPGKLPLFSNVEDGRWIARPNTILIDSEQLESGEAMSPDFKRIAAREVEEFKAEYRARFPGRDADALTDEDLLREVMNTVGKPGKLGEQVKCVVSVSMLTEGWDANTVTHVLGVRAFGTQLLCEQVVGRGLRRMSYALNGHGMFDPEYAEVYGVPFSFIPC